MKENKKKEKNYQRLLERVAGVVVIGYLLCKVQGLERELGRSEGKIMNLEDENRGFRKENRNLNYQLGKLQRERRV